MTGDLFKASSAVLSPCGRYRYRLDRRWRAGPTCGFIMLNPSTAGAEQDDPTIRRCIGFAKREGCGALIVVNLYAFRATKPDALLEEPWPIGPQWRDHFDAALDDVDGPIIAAWGAHRAADGMAPTVREILRYNGRTTLCLGVTSGGHPRHPLYVKGDARLEVLMLIGRRP